jgi:glucose/arabinose dehydrogenase/PKD repeat protein
MRGLNFLDGAHTPRRWSMTGRRRGLGRCAVGVTLLLAVLSVPDRAWAADTSPPTGTVVINGGASATNSRAVTLTLSATDALSAVTQMRFSNTGTSFSTAEAYATTKAWTLSSGAGTKTVYVQYKDAAGNWSSLPITDTIVLDTTAPTISSRTATAITSNASTITWITDEPATSQVNYGTTTSYGSTTPLDPALVTSHSVQLSGLSANTTYNYRVRSRDAAGNERVSSNSQFKTAAVDTVPPTVQSVNRVGASPTNAASVSWTVTFSETVTGVDAADFALVTTGSVSGAAISSVTGQGSQYSVTASTGSGSGTLGLNVVDNDSIVDTAANPLGGTGAGNGSFTTGQSYTIDKTAPSVTINQAAGQADPTSASPISFTVVFSESVSGFAGADVSFAGSTVSGTLAAAVSGAGPTYTVAVTGMTGTGTVVVSIPAGAATDAAGNASSAATGSDNTVTFDAPTDTTPPTVSITAPAAGSTVSGTVTVTANGSDNVGVTGVQFLVDGANLGAEDGAAPYGTSWDSTTVADGSHTLLARARDAAGNVTTSSSVTVTVDNAQTAGLVASWSFEEASGTLANDSSGNGNTATLVNGVARTPGRSGNGLTFDGIDDYLSVPNSPSLDISGTGLTLRMSINPQATGADSAVLSKSWGTTMTSPFYQYGVELAGGTVPNFIIGTSSGVLAASMGRALVTNQWSDLAITFDGSQVQFYVNGDPVSAVLMLGSITARGTSLHVGADATPSQNFKGSLDEVRIYRRALTTAELASGSYFQNEALTVGLSLPTTMAFLPGGAMLVGELGGAVRRVMPPYSQPDPTPFLQITNIGRNYSNQGLYTVAVDPAFTTNHYIYVFYTLGTPNHDRLSRFTVNQALTSAGSELVLYEDSDLSGADHHGGAIMFGNDNMLYVTTGDEFYGPASQDMSNPEGKILRLNPVDGSPAPGNPFLNTPGVDPRIWASGLRNPFRGSYDAPSGRMLIGDVGYQTVEEINIGAAGANYGWPNAEGPSTNPAYTNPVYSYTHSGHDSAVVGGFVYHGTQFPSSYEGSYFYADYAQHWIKRLTFDASGNLTGAFNFEPADGSPDGPFGDIVCLTEGPDGALYYVDLGFQLGGNGAGTVHRISYVSTNQAPVAAASATPTAGAAPLTVTFSSAGSHDPEGTPLSYSWDFGDGTVSSDANPTHTYATRGVYQARLTVSDGVNSAISTPVNISVGSPPVITAFSTTPSDGGFFVAGDVVSFSGAATDPDGVLSSSSYVWNIDFLHDSHVHPGAPTSGTSGTFTIPTTGHDFSGFTRYRITLTVTDADGLTTSRSAIIYPSKVNLTFDTAPSGLTYYIDGIAHTGQFVYDTLIGFHHTVEARDQTVGSSTYTFSSWSDGGTQQHVVIVPTVDTSYTATYSVVSAPVPITFVQVNAATPQSSQTAVAVAYPSVQTAGDTNIVAIGWNNTTSTVTSVVDSAGNTYRLAVPKSAANGVSQAIWYASNIKAAVAGANTVTVTFSASTPYVDLRALEYSGLDPANPFDAGASASGNGTSANSGAVTTTGANELILGAGMTGGLFSAAGTSFTNRIITNDADIAEDRIVTTAGSYSATATLNPSAGWVMQVATFRAATAGP